MFEDRNFKRTFSSAPQSITSLIAAFLEPSVAVLTFILSCVVFDEPPSRTALAVCLLVFALTFPGRSRFRDSKLTAALDIAASWVSLVSILALCACATRSLDPFDQDGLIAWVVFTPIFQWLAVRWLTTSSSTACRPSPPKAVDSLKSLTLGASHAPTRHGQLGCNGARDPRLALGGLSSAYSATTANCSAQFSLQ